MLHTIESDKGACSSKSSLAVDSNSSLLLFSSLQKFVDDIIWRWCSVQEVQVQVVYSLFYKLLALILWLIQSDNQSNAKFLENGHIVIWGKTAVFISDVQRSTERHKLLGHNPVKISIFDFLIMLVLLHIECVVIVPAEGDRELQAKQTVLDGALVAAGAHGGITERHKFIVVGLKGVPRFVSRPLENNDHKATHQEGRVGLLGIVERTIVVDFEGFIV